MATAYNPGLKITERMIFKKERRLPMKGEVLVKKGDIVTSDQVVARTFLPGNVELVNGANKLNIIPKDILSVMLKKVGDNIQKDEVIGQSSSFFGLFKYYLKSPVDGTIETISEVTGQIILREKPIPVEIKAYIDGEVIEVIEDEGAVIRTPATFIQGIFGIGGETVAELTVAVETKDVILKEEHIKEEYKGKIILGGSLVTSEAINKAIKVGAAGIIAGGINDKDLKDFLGYDLGVAITGSEEKGITLVITEGFGEISMAAKTFDLLKKNEGQKTSINGSTQIRAGVIRPEIIISKKDEDKLDEGVSGQYGMQVGCPVRIIREPNFGKIAKVNSLPINLQKMESETKVRVVEVSIDDGEKFMLPRANVEIIEG